MADQFPPDEADLEEPRAPKRDRRGARGAVLLGARIATGVIGCAIAAVVLGATVLVPLPELATSTRSTVVTPVAADQVRLCAGPLLRLGDAAGQAATVAKAFGSPSVRAGAVDGAVDGTADGPADGTADSTGEGAADTVESARLTDTANGAGAGPTVLTLPAEYAGADFGGSQVQVAANGDLAGLAAAGCVDGSGDTWLVGGSTETGRTTLLTLGNPTEVASTVSLEIFAEDGAIVAAGTEGITVPAGSQRVVSLAAFAPGVTSPVVRVTSHGGLIVANLQQSVVRTLSEGGVDIVSATTAPAEVSVIPGVVIANGEGVASVSVRPGFEDVGPVLRLYAPGGEEVDATIEAIREDGVSTAAAATVSVPAGKVAEFPLTAYPDGSYSLVITGIAPLVGAVRLQALGSAGQLDLAWLPAANPLEKTAIIPVAAGPGPVLHLANPGGSDVEATLTGPAGAVPVTLPAGTAIAIPLSSAADYRLEDGAGLLGSVVYSGDGMIAGFPVAPPASTSRPIRVYPG